MLMIKIPILDGQKLGNSMRSSNWFPIFIGEYMDGYPNRSESLPPFTTG